MMFETMALEQPHILVLNYAPGPLDTAMQVEARAKTGDAELRTTFQSKYHIYSRSLSSLRDKTLNYELWLLANCNACSVCLW